MRTECLIRDNSTDSAMKKAVISDQEYRAVQVRQQQQEQAEQSQKKRQQQQDQDRRDIDFLKMNFSKFCGTMLRMRINADIFSDTEKQALIMISMSKKLKLSCFRCWLCLDRIVKKGKTVLHCGLIGGITGIAPLMILSVCGLTFIGLIIVLSGVLTVAMGGVLMLIDKLLDKSGVKFKIGFDTPVIDEYRQTYRRLQKTYGKDFSPFTDAIPE